MPLSADQKLEVTYVPIAEIVSAEYNPRKLSEGQKQSLRESLTRFGFVDPVIVNKHPDRMNIMVGGHQRLMVWKEMGNTTVPAVFVSLTRDEERELNVRLNKNVGEFDWQVLQNNFNIDELKTWGFTDKELDGKFRTSVETEGDDDVPETVKTISAPGDVYVLGSHRLVCGDATVQADCEKLFDGKLADMIHTDPPYNVDYGVSKNPRHKIRTIENDKQTPAEWEAFCRSLFTNFQLYNKGDVYMWGASGPEGLKMRLWLIEAGCHWSATIIWNKDRLVLSPANYQRKYEPCFYGWFGKSTFNAGRKETEVWDLKRPTDSKLHPTMKPIEVCEKAILNSSRERDIVADFFLGSGSTLIACQKNGRSCYGLEIDPHYCDVIVQRYVDFCIKNGMDWSVSRNNNDISSDFGVKETVGKQSAN